MIKRGEIYNADLRNMAGSEQSGIRPVVIIQNDAGNENSPTTIVIPVTSRKQKHSIPTHVKIESDVLKTESTALVEQIRVLDKKRLGICIGKLQQKDMVKLEKAVAISLGIDN